MCDEMVDQNANPNHESPDYEEDYENRNQNHDSGYYGGFSSFVDSSSQVLSLALYERNTRARDVMRGFKVVTSPTDRVWGETFVAWFAKMFFSFEFKL